MELSTLVRERIQRAVAYIDEMERERMGYGAEPQLEVAATALSLTRGLSTLLGAEEVWTDGATGLSFGGRLPGGIVFGMIARQIGSDYRFKYQQMEWTFHS